MPKQKTRAVPERFVYFGPTLPLRGLRHGTIFKGGLPPNIKKLTEEVPMVNSAIVPVRQFGAVLSGLKDPTSAESAVYASLKGV